MEARPSMELTDHLTTQRERVEKALTRVLSDLDSFVPQHIRPALRQGVEAGGKRIRPILLATAYEAVTGAECEEAVYELSTSVEFIHGYSLMHDDLPCMDDGELRRGHPTTHRIHGARSTILAGAALIPLAALGAWKASGGLGLPGALRKELVRTLMQAGGAAGMVGGQFLDLVAEGEALSNEALNDLHARKTGALLTASLRMGGLAGQAAPEGLRALEDYGRRIGLAFQIADDVLDATSTAGTLGKNPSDRERGKSTYVGLHGVDGARARGKQEVDAAIQALRSVGIRSGALEELAFYIVERDR